MIDISDGGGYEKIRWNPASKKWYNEYIYFMVNKDKEKVIGIKTGFSIDWGDVDDAEWITYICDITKMTSSEICDFVDMAETIWRINHKLKNAWHEHDAMEIKAMEYRRMYESCHSRWLKVFQELREKWRYEYQRIMAAHKRDIEYWGGEKKFIEVSPEIVNLRRLQLELLREIRNTRS